MVAELKEMKEMMILQGRQTAALEKKVDKLKRQKPDVAQINEKHACQNALVEYFADPNCSFFADLTQFMAQNPDLVSTLVFFLC